MKKEDRNKLFCTWLEDIWEEIEVQFYGIIGAIFFFLLLYFFFHPNWMRSLIDSFCKIKLL